MSNRRNLKKDIDFCATEIVFECNMNAAFIPGAETEKLEAIAGEAWKLRNELLYKVNHAPEKTDKKAVKLHYRAIEQELISKTNELIEKLGSLHKE